MLNKTEVYITSRGLLEKDLKRAIAHEIEEMDPKQFTFTTAMCIAELITNDKKWKNLEEMREMLKRGY